MQRVLGCLLLFVVCSAASAAQQPDWPQRYQAFTQTLPDPQLFRYFELTAVLDKWKDDQLCTNTHLKKLQEALDIHPAALHILRSQYRCLLHSEPQSVQGQLTAIETSLLAIAEVILGKGQGLTADSPIIVREMDEAAAIFDLAELTVIEIEMLVVQQRLMLRFYLQDPHNGVYQYRYVSMFEWLSEFMRRNGLLSNDKDQSQYVTSAAYQMYLANEFDFALLYRAKRYISTAQYAEAVSELRLMVERSHLATSTLALVYSLQRDNDALDTLVPELVLAHENGEPSASAALAMMVLVLDPSAAAVQEAEQLLVEYSGGAEAALRQEMLLDLLSLQPEYKRLIARWLGEAPSVQQVAALDRVAALLQSANTPMQQQRGMALHQLSLQWLKKKEH